MTWTGDGQRWPHPDRARGGHRASARCPSPSRRATPAWKDFKGISFHTNDWPHEPLDLTGKRVAIIGTGATAIQIIPEVAKQCAHLTVFQRRANWAAPLNNGLISVDEMANDPRALRRDLRRLRALAGGLRTRTRPRSFYEVTPEERRAFYDKLYDEPGFGIWLPTSPRSSPTKRPTPRSRTTSPRSIRQRVKDPAIAEKLIPKDHGFGIQRLPLETGYFETYNRDNVELVNSKADADQVHHRKGFAHEQRARVRIRRHRLCHRLRRLHRRLRSHRHPRHRRQEAVRDEVGGRGPTTYLGMLVHGFPNLVMLGGPQTAAANFPRGSETAIEWVTPMLEFMRHKGYTRFEARAASQAAWTQAVKDSYNGLLMNKAQSWITGYNSNLDGHEYGHTRYNIFATGGAEYAKHLNAAAANDYQGIAFSRGG
jgi:cation diffusion facilitator CzcD-associated flavoprotein CzcO